MIELINFNFNSYVNNNYLKIGNTDYSYKLFTIYNILEFHLMFKIICLIMPFNIFVVFKNVLADVIG